MKKPLRSVVTCLLLLASTINVLAEDKPNIEVDILTKENLVAWCIVPFDAAKRTPEQRAAMLAELGLKRCAYDWRAEHVPTFEREILAYKKHNIEFFAFWGIHEGAFRLFKKHDIKPQIWYMMPQPISGISQAESVRHTLAKILPVVERTKAAGCQLGLYNHGGWAGEPENLVAICRQLKKLGHDHVGIVYNFHHAHDQIENWATAFALVKPHLLCLNINGMNAKAQPKILGIGKGQHELNMIKVVKESGYNGPIGILDHRNELDSRDSLNENLLGLNWVRAELEKPGSGGPLPSNPKPSNPTPSEPKPGSKTSTQAGVLLPNQKSMREPPFTVEVKATLTQANQYNILVASDTKQSSAHWELFTMSGSGRLTAYIPGAQPDHVRSEAFVCDSKPHVLAMTCVKDRVRLFVDGKVVADQPIQRKPKGIVAPGPLAIGRLVEGQFTHQGRIAWVRISQGVRQPHSDLSSIPSRDEQTLGQWTFGSASNSDSLTTPDPKKLTTTTPAPSLSMLDKTSILENAKQHGSAVRGAQIFASPQVACISCHQIHETGGRIGPALTELADRRNPDHILNSLLAPKQEVDKAYRNWTVITLDGKTRTGYIKERDADAIMLLDPPSGNTSRIAHSEIDELVEGSTLMPNNLMASMSTQQVFDMVRFLMDLRKDGPNFDALLKANHQHTHTPIDFAHSRDPIDPTRWPNHRDPVNQDRVYDFYTKQADFFRQQTPPPMMVAAFAGLDGGDQGHWGNQNEQTWKDNRWNDTELSSVQAGVFKGSGKPVARAVCVRLSDNPNLSACYDPDHQAYTAVWNDGFVQFSSVRYGFMDGLNPVGKLQPLPESASHAAFRNHLPKSLRTKSIRYRGYHRHGIHTLFSYQIGDVEYLDSAWTKDGQFHREVAPAASHSLRHMKSGSPTQWPQTIKTDITPGSQRPYAVDDIGLPLNNPWNALLFCSGHDFLPDGSALVCTMQGDVWHVSGLETGRSHGGTAIWKRFASGLHQPLGLIVADDGIFVQCRDQLTRLVDLNGDQEADFYECYSNAFQTSAAGHDYVCGLQRDSDGNFYTASGNQGLIRISADGQIVDVVATGFRNPDGIGMTPDGFLTVPVSEGGWTPASAINEVRIPTSHSPIHSQDLPPHFGFHGPRNNEPPELPLAYLPRGIDNSSGGQVTAESVRFGPLAGQLLHLSFGTGSWFLVLRDEVNGQRQGAVIPLTGDFPSGVHRGRFRTSDGQLYVSGMKGWGTYTPGDGCFQRVRFTGDLCQIPTGFHVHENGIMVDFAHALDAEVASRLTGQFAQCWNYRYSGAYGSPEFSASHPGVVGHDVLPIVGAHIQHDGKSVFLEIPDLQPCSQLHLRLHVNEEATEVLSPHPSGTGHELFITVHALDQPWTAIPNYVHRPKTIAAHPMLRDLAGDSERQPNPWTAPIEGARTVRIETGKNLTFATPEFTVEAHQAVRFTLSNPDVVPHNWVLVQPDSLKTVGELGNQMIADPAAFARQYVPDSDQVIAHTDIVNPDTEQTIYFRAPSQPGRYPFLCTFPGHWMVMNGTMIVK